MFLAPAPSRRAYIANTVVNNLIFLFGGTIDSRDFGQDMWVFDPVQVRWVEIDLSTSASIPSARCHSSMVHVPEINGIVLYGGMAHADNGNNIFVDDLWVFGIGTYAFLNIRPYPIVY